MASKASTALTVHSGASEVTFAHAQRPPRSMSVAVWLLIGLLAAVVITTLTIPVDKIVTSTAGRIVALKQMNVVQALDPSIIKSIDVREGEPVEAGQVLATLDEALTTADLDQTQAQVDGLKAQIARLEAELGKRPFNPPVTPGDGPMSYMRLQKLLYDKRAGQYAADVSSFDEKIAGLQVTIAKLTADVESYKQRDKIAQQVEGMNDSLYKSGSSSLLNLLTSTDARVEMERTMKYDVSTLQESQHQISSLQADRNSYIQKWFSDANTDLFTARNNLDAAQALLDKAAKHQDLVNVTAKEAGIVLSIAKVSIGSVLKQGDPLMTVMPLSTPLQVEVSIASGDIGFVKVGDNARIKIDAFNSSEHGYAEGKVVWISADAFTADDNGAAVDAYYKVHISILSNHFVGVPANFRLIPGMTLSTDINVGTRLLGRYLMGGAIQGAGDSMREP